MLEYDQPHSDPDKYIIGIKNNDDQCLKEIYHNFCDNTVRWVMKNGGSEADGLDVFQDGLLAITEKVFHKDFTLRKPFGAYLFGTCRFIWLKRLKNKKNETKEIRNEKWREHITKEEVEQLVELTIDGDRWRLLLERTFARLTGLCQQILTFYLAGKDADEIAAQMNMDKNNVYQNKNRCLKKWEEFIREDPDFNNHNPF